MYLSNNGRPGLNNIVAVVLRPDKTINGIFPLTELPGMFKGCYIYDYLTSVDDAEGEYFSRVVSPTEGKSDIVRFSLARPAGADQSLAARPVNIQGYLVNRALDGTVEDAEDLIAVVSHGMISGYLKTVTRLQADVGDIHLRGTVRAAEQHL